MVKIPFQLPASTYIGIQLPLEVLTPPMEISGQILIFLQDETCRKSYWF